MNVEASTRNSRCLLLLTALLRWHTILQCSSLLRPVDLCHKLVENIQALSHLCRDSAEVSQASSEVRLNLKDASRSTASHHEFSVDWEANLYIFLCIFWPVMSLFVWIWPIGWVYDIRRMRFLNGGNFRSPINMIDIIDFWTGDVGFLPDLTDPSRTHARITTYRRAS